LRESPSYLPETSDLWRDRADLSGVCPVLGRDRHRFYLCRALFGAIAVIFRAIAAFIGAILHLTKRKKQVEKRKNLLRLSKFGQRPLNNSM
jgi:hypothetical protein